jgi:uncharacterized repeat protein (TIGR04138 family)
MSAAMLDPSHPIAQLLKEDSRFEFEAYVFVFEALSYAQNVLRLGGDLPSELPEIKELPAEQQEETPERHISGQELCESIRLFALEQFGYMAKPVLDGWGIHSTGDFGEIVFNLIRIGQMKKTKHDCREDFEDVYDFEVAFRDDFKITPPEE